jgi:hypothetical protein
MKKFLTVFALALFACLCGAGAALGQTADPAITATRVFGKITAIDAPAGQLSVKTDAGSVLMLTINEKTVFQRMPPGETDRSKAIASALVEITVGDGVYARGYVSDDRKSMPAQQVIVVSQSEIAQKQERERQEWRKRGLNGIIESLNPQTKEITVTTRAAEGPKPVVIPINDKVRLRRYAPDSVRFSDAKKSGWEDLKVGDQVRAKGDKSTDGARFTAEEIVTGAFQTLGGAVVSVDAAKGEIKINDIQSKQPVTIMVSRDTTLKRVPAEFMQMMARGGGGGGAPGAGGGAPPQGGSASGGGGRPAGGQGAQASSPGAGGQQPNGAPGGGFDIQRIIENLPATTLAELKAGDMLLISSTKGADPSRATAITLVAGVEPIFAMLQARQGGPANRPPNLGTINIGIGGP